MISLTFALGTKALYGGTKYCGMKYWFYDRCSYEM